jgi:phage FluMu protein Com
MIQIRCLSCNRFLFNEELIEGTVERDCDRCGDTNRVERRGKKDAVRQTIKEEQSLH